MSNIHLTPKRFLAACLLGGLTAVALPTMALAATYDGGGLLDGLNQASGIGVAQGDLPSFIAATVDRAVNYATLAGVVVIVAAGFMLILGFGSDEWKEKAKKAITYVAAGLLVLYFAQYIVDFFSSAGQNESIRDPIIAVMNTAVGYAALAGVVTVVVAGFFLIFSFGDDSRKETAKKIIYYTLAGLFVLLMARVIVGFVLTLPAAG